MLLFIGAMILGVYLLVRSQRANRMQHAQARERLYEEAQTNTDHEAGTHERFYEERKSESREQAGEPMPPDKVPETLSEAYAVLNVHEGTSETVVKEMIARLRQEWHPDRSKNEADRERREAMIKRINVAADFFEGKRQ